MLAAWGTHASGADDSGPQYLYLWTAAADGVQPDFLAVLDVTESDDRYGAWSRRCPFRAVATGRTTPSTKCRRDGQLFANGFESGQSFVFDLRDPGKPRIVSQFGDVEGYSHPHSFLRLPERQRAGDVPDAPRTTIPAECAPAASWR